MRLEVTAHTTHADVRDDGVGREVEDRHRAVELVADVRVSTVPFDGDVVGKLADGDQLGRGSGLRQVDDRDLVGLVQRDEQLAAIGRDSESFRPTEANAWTLRGA